MLGGRRGLECFYDEDRDPSKCLKEFVTSNADILIGETYFDGKIVIEMEYNDYRLWISAFRTT